jgi:hypothetical protein
MPPAAGGVQTGAGEAPDQIFCDPHALRRRDLTVNDR